jgi:hypothetical protein
VQGPLAKAKGTKGRWKTVLQMGEFVDKMEANRELKVWLEFLVDFR